MQSRNMSDRGNKGGEGGWREGGKGTGVANLLTHSCKDARKFALP